MGHNTLLLAVFLVGYSVTDRWIFDYPELQDIRLERARQAPPGDISDKIVKKFTEKFFDDVLSAS